MPPCFISMPIRSLSIFTHDPEVLALGKTILFIEIFLEIGRAVNMCMVMALNASGDVRAPVTVGIIFMWSVATFGAWLLGVHLYWGLAGIWIAMAADECSRGIVFFWRWHQGYGGNGWYRNFYFINSILTWTFYHVIVWALIAMKKKSRFLWKSLKRVRRVGADGAGVIEVRF